MKRIVILSFIGLLSLAPQVWPDSIETTGGTVYQGTIIKMDEKEIVIKTATGVARVPRSKVKSFQSEPLPTTSGTPGITSAPQPTGTPKRPTSALAESAKQAVRALKKLEARCQVGISYKDYGAVLGDAKFEVNLFLEGLEAKKRPRLAESVDKVMGHYEFAETVWRHKFTGGRGVRETISLESDLGQAILKFYPTANKDFKEGGALVTFEKFSSKYYERTEYTAIFVDAVLPIIWKEASDELKKTTSLLSE